MNFTIDRNYAKCPFCGHRYSILFIRNEVSDGGSNEAAIFGDADYLRFSCEHNCGSIAFLDIDDDILGNFLNESFKMHNNLVELNGVDSDIEKSEEMVIPLLLIKKLIDEEILCKYISKIELPREDIYSLYSCLSDMSIKLVEREKTLAKLVDKYNIKLSGYKYGVYEIEDEINNKSILWNLAIPVESYDAYDPLVKYPFGFEIDPCHGHYYLLENKEVRKCIREF